MGYAKHVGRVGALAVALGIGAAVATTPGVAWAGGPDDSPAPAPAPASVPADTAGTSEPSAPSSDRPDPGELIRRSIERTVDNVRKVVTGVVQSSGGAITSTRRTGSGVAGGNLIPEILKGKDPQPPKDEPLLTLVQDDNDNGLRSFTPPRWRAPLRQVTPKPADKPVAKVLDDVKETVQQTISAVTGNQPRTGATTVERNAISTFDTLTTEDEQEERTGFVAPINIVTNVLSAALAPFLNTTPGEPEPQNPVLWAVLGWVRRQFQETPFGKFTLNRTPEIEIATPDVVDLGGGRFQITPTVSDPDGDDVTVSGIVDEDDTGTLIDNHNGTFTYEVDTPGWDEIDAITFTVSDAADYPHLHGLAGFFRTTGGHTASIEVTIKPAASALEVIKLPEGYTALPGSQGTAGPDGAFYQTAKKDDTGSYALVVHRPGEQPQVIELEGEPISELGFGPEGTLYQNIRTPKAGGGYDYAMTVITPAPAAASFAFMAANALDSGPITVSLPGEPVGLMAIGSDGTAYQPIRPPGETAAYPDAPCVGCSVAIVLPGSATAEIVVLSGELLHAPPKGSSSFTPDKFTMVTAGPNRTAYLTTTDFSTTTITVWRVDANAAIPTATPITLTGDTFNGPVGATIGADGTAYIATQVVTQDGTEFSYDTKLWVIAPDSDAPMSFELDGLVYGPVAVDDGIAYVTTSRISFPDSIEPTVIWRVDPTGANPPTPIEIEGQPSYSVLVAPDGTAYQTVYRESDNGQQFLMAVISPGSTSPTLVEDLGTFRSFFDQPMAMTPQGTVYQVLGNFDFDEETGDTTVFVFNGTTHVAIPLEGVVVLPAIVGADGKVYVAAATNIDLQTYTGDETLWVFSPGGAPPVGVEIGPNLGIPVSMAVGGDSAFLTTSRDDPNDPTTLIYEVTEVTIPSQAV